MTAHPKRSRDPNQLAKSIIDIATGEVVKAPKPPPKNQRAAAIRSKARKTSK